MKRSADRSSGILDRVPGEVAAILLGDESEISPPDQDSLIGSQLGPFRILQHLGSGGMGDVYQAEDPRLGRTVAIKLLPPWLRGPTARERFSREARAASALDHPNICTLHDIGETRAGRLYLVMAYYAGRTLDRVLADGPLEPERARDLAVQVARGLRRAHQAGIVHRDIKASNVILCPGDGGRETAKILDFGIARIAGETVITAPESRPGTPAVMAPEQARGEAVDARADIWALGVLLYEMLSGQRPFGAETVQATIHAVLNHEPTPLSEVRAGLPSGLEAAVRGALQKDPDRRFADIDAMLVALRGVPPTGETVTTAPEPAARRDLRPELRRRHRWKLLAAAVFVLLLLALLFGRDTPPTPAPARSPETETVAFAAPSLAVAPFQDLTGSNVVPPWAGAGVARLVSGALSGSRHLRVVAPAGMSTGSSESPGRDPEQLLLQAQGAGIDHLVLGELLPESPGELLLSVRLVSVQDGATLTSERRTVRDLSELLAAADPVARTLQEALNLPLAESVDVFAADFASDSPEAYGAYLEGLRAFAGIRFEEAGESFVRALELAPEFTMARYRMAHTLAAMGRMTEARTEIRRALAEAADLPSREAAYIRALEAYLNLRFEQAESAYRKLVEDHPYETEARSQLAVVLGALERKEDQRQQLELLARLAPEDPTVWSQLGNAYLESGELRKAVTALQRYAELRPELANAQSLLGRALRVQGQLHQAARALEEALRLDPGFTLAATELARVEALQGRWNAAEERLVSLVQDPSRLPGHRIDAVFELAAVLRSQGRFRDTLDALGSLGSEIEAEGTRHAWALALRGDSRRRLGEAAAARQLLDRAVELAPEPATRYLVYRGLLELEEGRSEALETTLAEILARALPPENPDRTEEAAAAYLRGRLLLARGEPERASRELLRASALEGYPYRLYGLAAAQADLARGRAAQALAAYKDALSSGNPREPRLDLELDRVLGLLLLVDIHEAAGDLSSAKAAAQRFADRWAAADPGARRLISERFGGLNRPRSEAGG